MDRPLRLPSTAESPLLLVAEDDPVVRLMLTRFLQRHGFQVVAVENGSAAVAEFDRQHPEMVLLDARMPDMDGFTACAEIKKRPFAATVPILMITALNDDQSVDQAFQAGAVDFITKPIHWAILRNRVHYLLKSSRADQQLQLAAKILENTTEGVVVTDASGVIHSVNPAFSRITGYASQEVVGETMSLVKSGRHDAEFYRRLWISLHETGRWQGEIWNRRQNGEVFPQWLSINAIRDQTGKVSHYVGIFADLTAIKESEEHLVYLAGHDAVTDLPNRIFFQERLHRTLAESRPGDGTGVLVMDLDRFKMINDTVGHDVGDLILIQVAKRLFSCVPTVGTLARMGGDEFGVIFPRLPHPQDAAHVAQAFLDILAEPFEIAQYRLFLGASIGISVHPVDGSDVKTLVKNAEAAMYHAKQQGRNNFQFYQDEHNVSSLNRMLLESSLRNALTAAEFVLHYQPQVDLNSGRVIGAEALIRWLHPERGMVAPGEFIPVAEETGLIVPIGRWALETACRQAREWQSRGYDLRVAVNLSGIQFKQPDFIALVADTLRHTNLGSHLLELELTESIAMGDVEETLHILNELNLMGLQLAIDDFGTGFSSLSYLKRFPIHVLKIDQSFVRNCTHDPDDAVIIRTVIGLAHSLNLKVIAEGVETVEQLEFLRAHRCDEIQGFLYSRPLPPAEFIDFLEDYRLTRPDCGQNVP